jgi:hypothetical protein
MIIVGIDKKTEVPMHWGAHGMWTSPLITFIMSFNKFIIIGTYLSIGSPNSNDNLARVR